MFAAYLAALEALVNALIGAWSAFLGVFGVELDIEYIDLA